MNGFMKKAIAPCKTTLIAQGMYIEGNIKTNSVMNLEGEIKGDVQADTIVINQTGKIEGNIRCKTLNIAGGFSGTIVAEKISVAETAKLTGDLEYKTLAVDYGAVMDCKLKRIDNGVKLNHFEEVDKIDKKESNKK